jgi:hypothetical protein
MAASPYDGLEARAFWRPSVAGRGPGRLRDLYRPRFAIGAETAVMTAGSCFAQHLHRTLKERGYRVIEEEPAPEGVDPGVAARHFYGGFSARYGNVYTARQFRQLLGEVAGQHAPAHPVWTRDGRFYDALRPNTEPAGFGSRAAVLAARADHLRAVSDALIQAEVVVFTLGLTETWEDRASGTVYPTAPGVIADPPAGAEIGFVNLSHDAVVADLRAVLTHLRAISPGIRMLLTVRPVPLTATASGEHILVASTASKAILRAAVATLMAEDQGVDYFPSYEIITNPAAKSVFYAANLRDPSPKGVSVVMGQFIAAQEAARGGAAPAGAPPMSPPATGPEGAEDDAVICEEMLNDPAARKGGR